MTNEWIYPINTSHLDREELIFRDTIRQEINQQLQQQIDRRLITTKEWIQSKVISIVNV